MELPAWHSVGCEELRNIRGDSVLIEIIPEDAYKQNSVYRPWGEIAQDPSAGDFSNRVDASITPIAVTTPKLKLTLNLKRTRSVSQ